MDTGFESRKRMKHLVTVGALACLTLIPGRASGILARLEGDTYDYSVAPTKVYGVLVSLDVAGPPAITTTKRAYLKFDVATAVPSGTTGGDIAKATLTLYVYSLTTGGSFDLVHVAGPWTEAALTYSTAPSLGTTEVSAVALSTADRKDFVTLDVTNVVKAWLNGSLTNNGLALVANGVDGINVRFGSKEGAATGYAPQLDITLVGGQVSAGDIVPGAVNTSHILDGTITGTDVADGGLRNVDINFGTTSGSDNTGVGSQALLSNGTGIDNTAVGVKALRSNTAGYDNSAVGAFALQNNTGGSRNTALGVSALGSNISGSFNTATGERALDLNQTGSSNSAFGARALQLNIAGTSNTAVGMNALNSNIASDNTAVGMAALQLNSTGTYNSALGSAALQSNTTGSNNTAVGVLALNGNVAGSYNVAVGDQALDANTGNNNTAVGSSALANSTIAEGNTAVGASALKLNTVGDQNTAVGMEALSYNTSGGNSAFGFRALTLNTNGAQNTALGAGALFSNTSGGFNCATGAQSLWYNTTGESNVALGFRALYQNGTGNFNTALGHNAMYWNTAGSESTAVGRRALMFSTASHNTAVGSEALYVTTTGYANTAIGRRALVSNTTGIGNTAVGQNALQGVTTGNTNVGIGNGAGTAITAGNQNIMILNDGVGGDDYTIRIGNSNHAAAYMTFIQGIYAAGVGGSGTTVMVDSNGKLGTGYSSARFKKDIVDMSDSSTGLMKLRPVTFHYKEDESGLLQYGLIAEEVADVYPDLVMYEDGRPLTVRYQFLVPMLLNELQKQQRVQQAQAEQINSLRAQQVVLSELRHENAGLTSENAALRDRLSKIEQVVDQLAAAVAAGPTRLAHNDAATPR